jgi:hypothetical protein
MSAEVEQLQEILVGNFLDLDKRIRNAPQDPELRANFDSSSSACHTIHHAKVEGSSFIFNWKLHRNSDEIALVLFCKNLRAQVEYAPCDPANAIHYIERFRVRYRQLLAYGISY